MEWPKLFKASDIKSEDIHSTREYNAKSNTDDDFKTVDELLLDLDVTFKRISDNLRLLKGSKEFNDEISCLLIDNRGGRKGFPTGVVVILLSLSLRHDDEYGTFQDK